MGMMEMKKSLAAQLGTHSMRLGASKHLLRGLLFLSLAVVTARADVIVSQTFSPDLTIPEGNPTGVLSSGDFTLGPADEPVLSITVDLNTSGGYNGDLYAYLVAPNGTRVTLLDQPGTAVDGFGAESSGMNITLDDTADAAVQNVTGGAGSVLTGTYQPDETMGTFDNSPANGTWDLYFADLGSDAGSPVLDSWTLNIDAVPEPVNQALGTFAVAWVTFAAVPSLRRNWRRKSSGH